MICLLLCLGGGTLCLYLREKLKAYSVKAVLLKSVVSLLFVAVGVCAAFSGNAAGERGLLRPFVLLGLVCGLTGDIWLDLKYVFPERDASFTYAGFCAFGVGHVLYIAGLLPAFFPAGRPVFAVAPLVLGVALSFVNAALEKPMKLNYGRLRPTVIVYGALLFSTLLLTGSLAIAYGFRERTLNLFFLGAALFAVSDLVLSGTYFGVGKDRPVDIILNYLTYYPAQFLIALSLLFLN